MAEEPDDLLSPEQIAAEIEAAGIPLTADNLQAMIEAARAEATKPREVELFPLKAVTPANIGYETARRACVSGALRATKIAGDWFVSQTDMASWLTSSGHWFESESAVERWRADIARLKRWWIA